MVMGLDELSRERMKIGSYVLSRGSDARVQGLVLEMERRPGTWRGKHRGPDDLD
jgi:hypothetical protein